MTVRSLVVGFCASLVVMLSACDSGPDIPSDLARWNEEVAQIDADLANSTASVLKDPSGIRIIVTHLGENLPAQPWHNINVDYIGRRYVDKVEFDDNTATGKLSGYIAGWQIAFSKLPAGSEGKVIIPSYYGYGPSGRGANIPGNTILEFDFKFNEVTMSSSDKQRFTTDTTTINQYLQGKGIAAIKDPTGVRYVITQTGIGPTPGWFDKLKLKYKIKLLSDDTKVIADIEREPTEEFYSRPIDFIHGMKIGLQKLNIGAKGTFYIPSGYAFGPDGVSDGAGNSIPSNANIIIEIEVIDVGV